MIRLFLTMYVSVIVHYTSLSREPIISKENVIPTIIPKTTNQSYNIPKEH